MCFKTHSLKNCRLLENSYFCELETFLNSKKKLNPKFMVKPIMYAVLKKS